MEQLLELEGVGITPACAGKTPRISQAACSSQDHPRVCGENRHADTMGL